MRTIHIIRRPELCCSEIATATYTVITRNELGAVKDVVEILVDFAKLASLAGHAVENTTGRAVLYYGAVVAIVQE